MKHLIFLLFAFPFTVAAQPSGTLNTIGTFSLGIAGGPETYQGPMDYRIGLIVSKPMRNDNFCFETGIYYAKRSSYLTNPQFVTGSMTLPLSVHYSAILTNRFRLYLGIGMNMYQPFAIRTVSVNGASPADQQTKYAISGGFSIGFDGFMGAGYLLTPNLEFSARFITRGVAKNIGCLGALFGIQYHFN